MICNRTGTNKEIKPIPSLSFRGEIMLVNGQPIQYGKQMLRKDCFYLTDLGIELPFSPEIDEFDQNYFNYLLISKAVKELQSLHPSIGLLILQQLPHLSEKNYCNLLLKLSLFKIKQILMHRDFFLHLWKALAMFVQSESAIQDMIVNSVDLCLGQLDQPYKRILYMLEHVPTSEALREALGITATELVHEIISSPNFLTLLSGIRHDSLSSVSLRSSRDELDKNFLKSILSVFRTMLIVSKSPQQTFELFNSKSQRMLSKLFTKELLNVIGCNFDHFFNYDRANLITVLSLIAAERGKDFWSQVISKKYGESSGQSKSSHQISESSSGSDRSQNKTSEVQLSSDKTNSVLMDNEGLFIILIANNFYEAGKAEWQKSLLILEAIVRYNSIESQAVLTRIFLQITTYSLNSEVIELSAIFLGNVIKEGQISSSLRRFIFEMMSIINQSITQKFNEYEQFVASKRYSQRGRQRSMQIFDRKAGKEYSERVVAFFRFFAVMIEQGLLETMPQLDCKETLEKLLVLTKESKGVIEGARRAFLIKRQAFIISEKLLKRKNGCLDQAVKKCALPCDSISKRVVNTLKGNYSQL